jgi:hypothetical protein
VLIAALGCNLAWGIIDGGMYLMARIAERGRNAVLLREVREATQRENAHRAIADALPPLLASFVQPAQLELMREGFRNVPDSEMRPRLTGLTGWAHLAFASLLSCPLSRSSFRLL